MKISEQIQQEIVDSYLQTKSTYKTAKEFNLTPRIIQRVIRNKNITFFGRRRYLINEDYFKEIDTPEKAYFLGFLYADGNVEKEEKVASITLQERDKYILEFFARQVYSNDYNLLPDFHDFKKYNGIRVKKWKLKMCSSKFVKNLIKLGCIPAKSFVLKFPTEEQVSDNFVHHFIRGVFDGDGCIYVKSNKYMVVSILGTENLLQGIQSFLIDKIGLKSIVKRKPDKKNLYQLRITNTKDCWKFANFIYDNDTAFLTRKKNKFLTNE